MLLCCSAVAYEARTSRWTRGSQCLPAHYLRAVRDSVGSSDSAMLLIFHVVGESTLRPRKDLERESHKSFGQLYITVKRELYVSWSSSKCRGDRNAI